MMSVEHDFPVLKPPFTMTFRHRMGMAASAMALLGLLGAASPAVAQDSSDLAVNELCLANAQDIGPLSLPYGSDGTLEDDPVESRVDFYRFEAEPGLELDVNLRGQPNGFGDLRDTILGQFNSTCQLVASNDDSGSLDSFLRVTVPADGVFVLAAARYSDFEFNGMNQNTSGNTYFLSVELAPPTIGSISARLVNRLTGFPVPGDQEPYANATLYRCGADCDEYIGAFNANNEGVVRFNALDFSPPLGAGTYLLRAQANDFSPNESGRFDVSDSQDFSVDYLPLTPPPIAFGNTVACEDFLPQGGTCTYDVSIDNNTEGSLTALVWSEVENFGLESPQGYTRFEASSSAAGDETVTRARVEVPPLSSSVASFSFEVPSFVPEGAQFCQSAFLGLYPNPLVNTFKQQSLFCVVKGADGFEKLEGADMAKASARHNERVIDERLRSQGLPPLD